jgi:beta-galactosidase
MIKKFVNIYQFNLVSFIILPILLGFTVVANAQKADNQLPDWENSKVIGRHKLPGHASFVPFPDIESALADTMMGQTSPWYKSLNGKWKFKRSKNPAQRPKNFYKPSYSVKKWVTVRVPGNWQLEGYGHPIYLNSRYPFQPDFNKLDPPGFHRTSIRWVLIERHSPCQITGMDERFSSISEV